MKHTNRMDSHYLTQGAALAALYVALTYAQGFLLPNSTSMAMQFRLSEALSVFAFFAPAAAPGLALGCLLYNLSNAGALPLDFVIGTAATFGACWSMRRLRNVRFLGIPLAGLLMPALWNGILVGAELTLCLTDAGFSWPVFGLNALCVAAGEAAVLLIPGSVLYLALRRRDLKME